MSATRGGTLTGTGSLVRLILRRDRIRLPIWIVAILGLVYSSAAAVQGLYSTQAELDAYARTMGNSAASIAFSGPPTALNTTGGVTIFEVNQSAIIAVALMAIFLVVRHTRAEEEEGRTELLRSTVVGRHAPTVAALLVVGGACAVVGLGVAALLISLGLPVDGSLASGASLWLLGLAYTAVGACAAQVTGHARSAIGMSLVVLAVSFMLRAVGDVGKRNAVWLSPMGWMQAVRPYADERWWPMLALVAFFAIVLGVAAQLTSRRQTSLSCTTRRWRRRSTGWYPWSSPATCTKRSTTGSSQAPGSWSRDRPAAPGCAVSRARSRRNWRCRCCTWIGRADYSRPGTRSHSEASASPPQASPPTTPIPVQKHDHLP